MITRDELKESYRVFKIAEMLSNTFNDGDFADAAYNQMYDKAREVAKNLVEFTNGKLNETVALKMVLRKGERLEKIIG